MKDLISAAALSKELYTMRALLTDAVRNDGSLMGDMLRDYRKGSLKAINDVLQLIREHQKEDE
jgi:hypothetical protein